MKKLFFINIVFLMQISLMVQAEINNLQLSEMIKKYLIANGINNEFSLNKKQTLPDCDGKIHINNRFKQFKTLEIICLGKQNWSYNIRTNLKVLHKNKTIKKKLKNEYIAVFTKNGIKKGDIFNKADLLLKKVVRTGSLDYFKVKEDIIGKVAKVTIRENQIIRNRHLVKKWTIKEGQKVIIENNRSNIQILVEGIATKSAMKGEYLEVLNKSSGDIIKGWVKNNKKVTIFR